MGKDIFFRGVKVMHYFESLIHVPGFEIMKFDESGLLFQSGRWSLNCNRAISSSAGFNLRHSIC